ncbi:MAG: hypothetical protein AAF242_01405 [Bacteroidota bacterium]
MDISKVEALTDLLLEAGHQHHQAFIEVDGDDPEWPIWYAEYLVDKLPAVLGKELTKSRIVYLLIHFSETLEASEGIHWTKQYAIAWLESQN